MQAAVDAANSGDEIRVAAGVYAGVSARSGLTQTVYISKTVTVRGGYTTATWMTPDPLAHPTILDAQGRGRVIVVRDAAGVTLDGLHLTGGDATGLSGAAMAGNDAGGGLYGVSAISLTLSHSQVYSNSARSVIGDYRTGYGGGVYLNMCDGARLEGNTLRGNGGNRAWNGVGGGAYLFRSSHVALKDNAIRENVAAGTANREGGGLYLADCNDATLAGNLVADNVASNGANAHGGRIYLYACSRMLLEDNRVTRLRASDAANNDYFGHAVAISDDQIVAGAYGKDGAGNDRGAAYVFALQPYEDYLPLMLRYSSGQ